MRFVSPNLPFNLTIISINDSGSNDNMAKGRLSTSAYIKLRQAGRMQFVAALRHCDLHGNQLRLDA